VSAICVVLTVVEKCFELGTRALMDGAVGCCVAGCAVVVVGVLFARKREAEWLEK